jgi:hypothetical protein
MPVAADLLRWLEQHEKLSGWAQVAGSLIALGVAVWIAWREGRRARLALLRDKVDRADVVLALARRSLDAIEHRRSLELDDAALIASPRAANDFIREAAILVGNVPPHELPTAELARAFLQFRSLVTSTVVSLEGDTWFDEKTGQAWDKRIEMTAECYGVMRRLVDQIRHRT